MVLLLAFMHADEDHVGALIVDDNEDMRSLVRLLIDLHPELEVTAEADDGTSALEAWRRVRPDVVVLDQQLPGGEGLDVAEIMLLEDPTTAIVLFSAYLDDDALARADRLGVRACLSKDQATEIPALLARHRRQ